MKLGLLLAGVALGVSACSGSDVVSTAQPTPTITVTNAVDFNAILEDTWVSLNEVDRAEMCFQWNVGKGDVLVDYIQSTLRKDPRVPVLSDESLEAFFNSKC